MASNLRLVHTDEQAAQQEPHNNVRLDAGVDLDTVLEAHIKAAEVEARVSDILPASLVAEWSRKTIRAAQDIVEYGVHAKGNIELDRLFTNKAMEAVEPKVLDYLANCKTPYVGTAVQLIKAWKDQERFRVRVDEAAENGQQDYGALEAKGIMMGKVRQLSGGIPKRYGL